MRLDYFRSNGRESLASVVIRFGADLKIVLAATPDREVRGARVGGAHGGPTEGGIAGCL